MINCKIKHICTILIFLFLVINNVQATEIDTGFNSYIEELNNFVKTSDLDIDINRIANNLKEGKGLSYNSIFEVLGTVFFKQIRITLSSAIVIIILVLISSLIKSLQIGKSSEVIKLTNMVCFISLSLVLTSTFINMIELFKQTCNTSGTIMQVVSPFLLGMLIVNGAITSVGIIQPLILFFSSFTVFMIQNIILPILIMSIILGIIGNLSDKSGILKLASSFRKGTLWALGIILTIFIGILSMETSITKDVDSLAVKTTTATVSNFVPVVGKFFSDSLETVIGASKIITKVGGIIGIITVIIISFIPVIKLFAGWIIYSIISILSEIIDADSKIIKVISEFSDIYKTMCGILIANSAVFIISIGIILNLSSNIVK